MPCPPRRSSGAALLPVLLALAFAASPPSAAAAGPGPGACAAAQATPTPGELRRAEDALLCLMNRERSRHGVRPLHANRCLRRAAAGHARDMVQRRYFAHESRDGRDFSDRIRDTGYVPPTARWTLGENLAWGEAPLGDPAWVLGRWMESPGHRANVLRRAFRDVGVAAVFGAPVRDAAGPRATYAVSFGAHSGGPGRCG